MSTPDDVIYPQPPEQAVLQAIGIVAIRHSEHEDALRMLLRTFLHQDAQEARQRFAYMGPRILREKVAEIGRAIFGPGEVLDQLAVLLARSEQLSKQRNEWVHALYGVDWLDRPLRREKSGKWVEQPTQEQLNELATQIDALTQEIRHARSHGFMAQPLADKGHSFP
jgi:hypothetical protein